jgi:hypothetical protein
MDVISWFSMVCPPPFWHITPVILGRDADGMAAKRVRMAALSART